MNCLDDSKQELSKVNIENCLDDIEQKMSKYYKKTSEKPKLIL